MINANIITEDLRDDNNCVMLGKDFIERTGGIVCKVHRTYNCECPNSAEEKKKTKSEFDVRVDTI